MFLSLNFSQYLRCPWAGHQSRIMTGGFRSNDTKVSLYFAESLTPVGLTEDWLNWEALGVLKVKRDRDQQTLWTTL